MHNNVSFMPQLHNSALWAPAILHMEHLSYQDGWSLKGVLFSMNSSTKPDSFYSSADKKWSRSSVVSKHNNTAATMRPDLSLHVFQAASRGRVRRLNP